MYQPVIDKSYLVEVLLTGVPAAGSVFNFVDIPQLRSRSKENKLLPVKTKGISIYTSAELAVTPNGKTTVAVLTGIVVTLAIMNKKDIFQFPAIDLLSSANAGLIRLFMNKEINFPKSYITILDATGLNADESVPFNIIYDK